MALCASSTLMTVCPTHVTTTHSARMVSIITPVFVSRVSQWSSHHKGLRYILLDSYVTV